MGIFEHIFNKFLQNNDKKVVDISKNISKFDGINLNALVVFAPKNIVELNKVIDCISMGQSIIINFSSIKKSEYNHLSNYLSGAIYAMRAKVYRLQSELYVIAPKNVKIATL